MELIITLRAQVETQEQGKEIYQLVKQKLEERPDVTITGHVTNHFKIEDEPQ